MNKQLKSVLIFMTVILGVFGVIAIAQQFKIIDVTGAITENLDINPAVLDVSGTPNEVVERNLTCTNTGNAETSANLEWIETLNGDGVVYTTDMTKIITCAPLTDTDFQVYFTYDGETPVGSFTGYVNNTRINTP